MADDAHPTRQSLLDAGLALAETSALSTLSIDVIVREANVAKGTFYVHFSDRASYLVALHRRFHDRLADDVRAASGDLPRGGPRLKKATIAYLNGCLRARGVKAMLLEARGEPAIANAVATSNERFARGAAPDFQVLGVKHPGEHARLFVAMVAETALLDLGAVKRKPALRAALWDLAGIDR
jgi:AcrR family transcriptional regulator